MNLFITLLLLASASFVLAADENESCSEWADAGECATNPDFMLLSCPESCAKITAANNIKSLYDIVETDINGKEHPLSQYKGHILYIVNVASRCGYTAENYETFRHLAKYRDDGVVTMIAPCNQFGRQEPGDASSIVKFAAKEKFEGVTLRKSDVNGASTRPLFAYLKRVTGKGYIQWNFDGKFLCNREGECSAAGSDVEAEILKLLGRTEL